MKLDFLALIALLGVINETKIAFDAATNDGGRQKALVDGFEKALPLIEALVGKDLLNDPAVRPFVENYVDVIEDLRHLVRNIQTLKPQPPVPPPPPVEIP